MVRDLFDPNFIGSAMFDGIDLSRVYFISSLAGSLMALYVMQLLAHDAVKIEGDCWFARYARRFALAGLSLAMLWSLAYSTTKGWQPWPPTLACTIAVDIFLISTIIVAIKRRRALG